ncbi:MAG: ATP-binding protein [Clostridiales bacterium]
MFYGREKELEFLNKKYKSKKSELIIMYGRRRIGKTELLRFFSEDIKNHIFYVARECTDKEQLESFSKILLSNKKLSYINSFSEWENVFKYIAAESKNETKNLIIMDEFPYIVYSNKTVLSILQNFWDLIHKNSNLMIILCGSAMSFIEKEILSEKAPLYGRATGIYRLNQMDFLTASLFFKDLSSEEIITIYSILGGVPHYLSQFDPDISIEENIKDNILSKGCVLYSEIEFLIKQELRETSRYYTIIEAIAFGNTKLNDIHTKTQIDSRQVSVYLSNLIELNIIEREYPIDYKMKKKINQQSGLYKLKDNFFRFYFRFVFPYLSELEIGNIDVIYNNVIFPNINEFVSIPFEEVCIQYLQQKNIIFPVQFTKIGRWWNKVTEIDIVAMNLNKVVLVGECKWKNSKMDLNEYKKIIEKLSLINADLSQIYVYLFSKSGFEKSLIDFSKSSEKIKLISISDLMS